MLSMDLISPLGISWEITAFSISIPSVSGRLQILPGHTEILLLLKSGEISIDGIEKIIEEGNDNIKTLSYKKIQFHVEEGCVEVKNNKIVVLGNMKKI